MGKQQTKKGPAKKKKKPHRIYGLTTEHRDPNYFTR